MTRACGSNVGEDGTLFGGSFAMCPSDLPPASKANSPLDAATTNVAPAAFAPASLAGMSLPRGSASQATTDAATTSATRGAIAGAPPSRDRMVAT